MPKTVKGHSSNISFGRTEGRDGPNFQKVAMNYNWGSQRNLLSHSVNEVYLCYQYLFKTCKAREIHSEFMLLRQDYSHDRIRLFAVFEACN